MFQALSTCAAFCTAFGLVCVTASFGTAREKSPTADQFRFFETNIRPILAEHCYRCHGSAKQRADLRLDTLAGIRKGSSTGAIVDKEHPEKSLLLKAIRHEDPELKMPPDRKLSDRQIADITRWVKQGMPYPSERIADDKDSKDKPHWAFQPAVDPVVPAVKDTAWPRGSLDRFILARLESRGLKPASPADRRTLIRRVTFDLTGLPPTPEEVEAFLKDTSPDAYVKVVDRLLASPHYGERWGRHWLDVARYADSNGLDENVAYGNAWRYRDYVVAAFNQDKPYDRFLVEQIAGDLLPASDESEKGQQLIATGFLALGPKVLAEVDEKKMELDIVDEQLDTFGRAILGMTFGCARCHDHKFDPITAKDYYGLAGIFQSTKTMEHFKKIARWHENPLTDPAYAERKAAHERKVAQTKEAIADLIRKADQAMLAKGIAAAKNLEPHYPPETKAELKRLRDELAKVAKSGPEMGTAMGVTEAKVMETPLYVRGNHLKPGKVVPRQVPEVLAVSFRPSFDSSRSGRLELAQWLIRPNHPLTVRVVVNRIWRWHFGAGLVSSTDNFGTLGAAPSHPELLDWLAHRFIENRWSIKSLHRMILLSSTYQQSSVGDAKTVKADPENRLLGRSSVKRLEAEAVRDSILAVTGKLDRTMGGSMLHVKNREFLFDHTSKDGTKYDSLRRSIYLPVIRNNVYDVFQLFDFPDPAVSTGDRATTTVAPQALFLMNSDWVGQLCDHLAVELLATKSDDAGRVKTLYLRAYGRTPTEKEVSRSLELVRGLEAALGRETATGRPRNLAWACLCQTVIGANEFIYVE